MARNRSNKPATIADTKRLINQTLAQQSSAPNRRATKSNSRGPSDAPTALGTTTYNRGPAGSITRVSNVEFIADLNAGGPIQGWDLNPASGSLFTWLARVASGFEYFRFTNLTFTYTPLCSSSTAGVVVMAPDYDASDPNPVTKQALTAYSGSVRTNVWNKATCKLVLPSGWYYVGSNQGAINPVNTDVKFYDVARFYAGLFNTNGNGTTGELTVSYTVEFCKPDFGPAQYPGEFMNVTVPNVSNPIGGVALSGNFPVTVANPANGAFTMTFPNSGSFIIELRDNVKSSTSLPNTWQYPVQQDPGTAAPVTLAFLDGLSGPYIDANTIYGHIALVYTNVIAGTVITFTLNTSVTAISYFIARVMSYTKNAG